MISELCKVLVNERRLEMLRRVYVSEDGTNVGYLAGDESLDRIGEPGVSQNLKRLASVGIVRRVRAGRYVNYVPNRPPDDSVSKATEAIVGRLREGGGNELLPTFAALMNPFRAKVVAAVAKAGSIPAVEICARLEHQPKYLKRDLQKAIDAGILDAVDEGPNRTVYRYVQPNDRLLHFLVSLVA